MNQVIVSVAERSGIGEARRRAAQLVAPLGFADTTAGKVALCVTEAATNVVRHGAAGEVLMRALEANGTVGIEVLCIDRGPGIASVAQSMRDGHSTAGSAGLGLGSLARVASRLDIFSTTGTGTALRFEIWDGSAPDAVAAGFEIGVVCVAKPGETACGDGWALHSVSGRDMLLVVDGLGHGADAATAARTACDTFARRPELSPSEQMAALHAALRPTRGAAAAVATITAGHERGAFCGVGNIRCVVRAAQASRSIVSHNGTLGYRVSRMQEFAFPFPRGALLVMQSDGIGTHWNLDAYPGLEAKHPALVAAVLYRDFARGNDDATIVALRHPSNP